MNKFKEIQSPVFVMEEALFRRNLQTIARVKNEAGVEIILALKAFAMWSVFPIMREYGLNFTTASSVAEARLAYDEMGSYAHSYTPAYTDENFEEFLRYSSHITFNSLGQFERFYPRVKGFERKVSCGLRINVQYSVIDTDLYNPSMAGSRFGVTADIMGSTLPEGIEGLHCHNLCESRAEDLEKVLEVVEEKFGHLFGQIKWLNMGGGHLMTRNDYDTAYLVRVLKQFREKYPHIELILEPGSAFAWETGYLVSTVVDIVENSRIKTAILDVSFACHMPDCLEMPYKPVILGAREPLPEDKYVYRMGGNSCLSGDFCGEWSFDTPLQIGQRVVFNDMIHYTTVKTTMFNGVAHPSIGLIDMDGHFRLIRRFGYEDFRDRLS